MRYTDPKEKSAELLRLALSHMGRHSAAFNPLTFTLWYEFAAGTNPQLNAAVDLLSKQSLAIDDAQVLQLCQKHVFPPDEDGLERIRAELQKLMLGVGRSAVEASGQAGSYGQQLAGFSAALASQDAQRIAPQVEAIIAGTTRMKQQADALRDEVESSQHEIERLRLALDHARGEAMVDALTGVLNRKGFDKALQAMLATPPGAGRVHVLVMLDIDHFKKVNDTHGHLMGDRVIQGLGEILRATVKLPQATASRYGGEEFAVLLPHSRLGDAQALGEAIRARTKALKIRNRSTQEVLVSVTISGGVAAWQAGDAADDLVARADAALYLSKHAGRDRITVG